MGKDYLNLPKWATSVGEKLKFNKSVETHHTSRKCLRGKPLASDIHMSSIVKEKLGVLKSIGQVRIIKTSYVKPP